MPDILFGGPGRVYDDSPATSAAFPAPVAAGKAASVVHADDAAAAEKAPPETAAEAEAAPATEKAPEEAH